MFEIKMTIEIPGLPEALNALAGAIGKQPEFVCHQHGGNNHHIDNAGVVNVDFPAAPAPAAPVVNPTTCSACANYRHCCTHPCSADCTDDCCPDCAGRRSG